MPYFGAVPQLAPMSDWEVMEVLVTVKAYPSVSGTYGEAVCVAGVRLDTPTPHFVRFFPVGYRDLCRSSASTSTRSPACGRASTPATDAWSATGPT